jgi:hypothetical protein
MSDRTEAPYKPPLSAILFDLRSVIGLLFVVYGIVLTILGIIGETPEQIAKSGGLALNLWTGLVMLVVGILFYVWAFMKPPLPQLLGTELLLEPERDHVDHYVEGGPMHMGHDFAELHPDEAKRREAHHRRHGSSRGGHGH